MVASVNFSRGMHKPLNTEWLCVEGGPHAFENRSVYLTVFDKLAARRTA